MLARGHARTPPSRPRHLRPHPPRTSTRGPMASVTEAPAAAEPAPTSAAGGMTSAGIVNALPALMMLNPSAVPLNPLWLVAWVVAISGLGVVLAVPAKRQMINIEQLPYPSGIAAATTLKSLHAEGSE